MFDSSKLDFSAIFGNSTIPLKQILSINEQKLLLNNIQVIHFKNREIIAKQGSISKLVYYVVDGHIKISRELRRSKNIVLKLVTPGNFIGIPSLLNGITFNFTLSSVKASTVCQIPFSVFDTILENNHKLSKEFLKCFSKDYLYQANRLSGLLFKQLPGRVADLILYFAEEIYSSDEFEFPLNRSGLAEICGTTKESLIRTLSEFNHDRIIELNRNSVKINSYDILKTLSKLG
jgi:CRP-like cAMP-binding protein